ncbi:hypothetical protein C8R46DRAFT_432630 [Mycena filopes]|nr:hypothetical protein C8R46DRAFT_432630 [Mycena filopes]
MSSNSLPLNDDIIDRIFTFCAEFQSLLALKATCKSLHGIFSRHPNSINLAVAHNLTETFPDALRVLRQEVDGGAEEESSDVDEDDREDDGPTIFVEQEPEALEPVTADELPRLRKNDAVVYKLECIFSKWYKDRKAPASVLSPAESFRFRRALYRVMLYSTRFTSIGADLEDNEGVDGSSSGYHLRKRRSKMLAAYATTGLYEIHSVVLFLESMVHWVFKQSGDDGTSDICLAAGPALILATYESRDTDTMLDACPVLDHTYDGGALFKGFFHDALGEIWELREADEPTDESAHLSSILETVPDGLDSCSRCGGETEGLQWTSATWQHYATDLPDLLPGRLSLNRQETTALLKFLQPTTEVLPDVDVLIAGIYRDLAPLQPEFEGWTADDGLCGACLEKLLRAHTHLWLFERKIQDGWIAPEDCWYGYDCRTQFKNAEHAAATNHLCEPTKGVAIEGQGQE